MATAPETTAHTFEPSTHGEFTLAVTSGASIQTHSLVSKRTWTIGRDDDADIVVSDGSVSRKHALLVVEPLMIQDYGSRNGTFVGGKQLGFEVSVPLELGIPFVMGNVTAFVYLAAPEDAATRAPGVAAGDDAVVIDPVMVKLYARLDVIAPSGLNLLVFGETGVGKEVFAEAIHARSARAGEFLQLNCAALPESILEGELFGHEKGAFTGATSSKPGLFEAANGGTVFLDEIGELPLPTQAKLLRVLESGEILRLGARKTTRVDVRFIGATHRDLRAMVALGTFRQDLYYRINGLALTLPPLRDRGSDIEPLAELFIRRSKRPHLRLSSAARTALGAHGWPGNIRELRNVIARACVLAAGDVIQVEDLVLEQAIRPVSPRGEVEILSVNHVESAPTLPPAPLPRAHIDEESGPLQPGETLEKSMREFERQRILSALEAAGGSKVRAAEALGLTRHALAYRMRELDIRSGKSFT